MDRGSAFSKKVDATLNFDRNDISFLDEPSEKPPPGTQRGIITDRSLLNEAVDQIVAGNNNPEPPAT